MSPGDGERRPLATDGASNPKENKAILTVSPTGTEANVHSESDVEARAGDLRRVTLKRTARATCSTCGAGFTNTGAAASHARGARHVVGATYSTEFVFIPTESFGGAP